MMGVFHSASRAFSPTASQSTQKEKIARATQVEIKFVKTPFLEKKIKNCSKN